MHNRRSQAQRKVNDLLSLIHDANDGPASQTVAGKKVVLVVGNTGSGKSTFVNYMLGRQIFERADDEYGDMVVDCRNPIATIGHSKKSETYLTSVYSDEESKISYIDCPGFGDNRGAEVDIVNMYSIARLLRIADKLQGVVFLTSFASLQADRGNSLRRAIKTMASIFGETDWRNDNVLSNTMLLITGAEERRTTAQLRNILRDIVREEKLLPEEFVNTVEAYDPLDKPTAGHFLHRRELLQRLTGFQGIPIDRLDGAFALSSESMLCLEGLLETLNVKCMDSFRAMRIDEVSETLQTLNQLLCLECSIVDDKLDTLLDRLRAEVTSLAAQDSQLANLRVIASKLAPVAETATAAIEQIESRLEEKKRLTDAKEQAEKLAAEEKVRRVAIEQEMRLLGTQVEALRIDTERIQQAQDREAAMIQQARQREAESHNRAQREAAQYMMFNGRGGSGYGGGSSYSSPPPPPPPSFSSYRVSSNSSVSSSGGNGGGGLSWNAYRTSIKGQGMSPAQISAGYARQKKR